MTTIEDKHAGYLFFTAKVFRILAWVYSVVAIANVVNAVSSANQLSNQLRGVIEVPIDIWSVVMTLVSSALVAFFLYTFSKVLDFLGELAVWVTDLWKRTEAIRRGMPKSEPSQ